MEVLVAIIGAVLALFGFQAFNRYKSNKGQQELNEKVIKLEKKEDKMYDKLKKENKKFEKGIK